jgi:hypothetical protein
MPFGRDNAQVRSMAVDRDSRSGSALRLLILLVVTGVVVALVMAGAVVEVVRHLNVVGH